MIRLISSDGEPMRASGRFYCTEFEQSIGKSLWCTVIKVRQVARCYERDCGVTAISYDPNSAMFKDCWRNPRPGTYRGFELEVYVPRFNLFTVLCISAIKLNWEGCQEVLELKDQCRVRFDSVHYKHRDYDYYGVKAMLSRQKPKLVEYPMDNYSLKIRQKIEAVGHLDRLYETKSLEKNGQ